MDEKLLKSVKTNLRAVVQSSAECIFVHQASRQYKDLTGEDLPYHKLGFSSPRNLIEYINDAVYIKRDQAGDILLNVPDNSSIHIDDMVKFQKVPVQKSRRRFGQKKLLKKNIQTGLAPIQIPQLIGYNKRVPSLMDHLRTNEPQIQDFRYRMNERPKSNYSFTNHPSQVNVRPFSESLNQNSRSPINDRPASSSFIQNSSQINDRPVSSSFIHKSSQVNDRPASSSFIRKSSPENERHLPFQNAPSYPNNNYDALPLNAQLKLRVGEICNHFPDGASFSNVQAAYSRQFLETLNPNKFGFSRWTDFIEQMPDVAHIRQIGENLVIFPSTKSQHKSQNNGMTGSSNLLVDKTRNGFKDERELSSPEVVWSDEDSLVEEGNKLWAEAVANSGPEIKESRLYERRNDCIQARSPTPEVKEIRTDQRRNDFVEVRNSVTEIKIKPSRLNSGIKSAMKATINNYPSGLPLHELLKAYQKLTGHMLTLTELGYFHILELVNELPDIMHIGDIVNNVSILFPGPAGIQSKETYIAYSSPEPDRQPEGFSIANIEYKQLIQEMLLVVCSMEKMLTIDEFLDIYEEEYHKRFKLNDTYHSPVSIFEKFDDYFVLQYFKVLKVSATQKGKDYYEELIGENKNFKLKSARKKERSQRQIATDVVLTIANDILPYPLPTDFKIGNSYPVHISSAEDPHRFRFQFENTQEELQNMHEEINVFYNDEAASEKYQCYLDILQPGMPCVVYYDQCIMWNRALITRISGGDISTVLFDYGNSVTVPVSKIRFIKKKFLEPPAFCFQACLHGVKAICKGIWTKEALKLFYDLSRDNSILDATFLSTERPFQLVLYTNENGKRESIADTLIKYNHAESSVPRNRESPNMSIAPSDDTQRSPSKSSSSSNDDNATKENNSDLQLKKSSNENCRLFRCTIKNERVKVINIGQSYYFLALELLETFCNMKLLKLFIDRDGNCYIVRKLDNNFLFKELQSLCGLSNDNDIRLIEASKVSSVIDAAVNYYTELAKEFREFTTCFK